MTEIPDQAGRELMIQCTKGKDLCEDTPTGVQG
jgi:hypothetical protein